MCRGTSVALLPRASLTPQHGRSHQRHHQHASAIDARHLCISPDLRYIGGRWQIGLDVGGNPIRTETPERTASRQLRLWLPLAGGILFPDERHAQSH